MAKKVQVIVFIITLKMEAAWPSEILVPTKSLHGIIIEKRVIHRSCDSLCNKNLREVQ